MSHQHLLLKRICLACFAALTVMNTVFLMKPTVVTFDKKKVVAQFVSQLSQHSLSDKVLAQKTKQFSQALHGELNAYSDSHHVLILNQSDVLAGYRDITPFIMRCVADQMRGQS